MGNDFFLSLLQLLLFANQEEVKPRSHGTTSVSKYVELSICYYEGKVGLFEQKNGQTCKS